MNTLIKPPCTNRTAQDRQPVAHLVNLNTATSVADITRKAADKVTDLLTRDIDWNNTSNYWLSDRHGDEEIFIFENAVKYAQILGYTVYLDENDKLDAPWAVKGYNKHIQKIDKNKFSCVLLSEDEDLPVYASKEHILEKFKQAYNWETFRDYVAGCIQDTVNDCLLNDDTHTLTLETAKNFVDCHAKDIVESLTEYYPYHIEDPWNDPVTCEEDWDEYIEQL